MPDLTFPSLAGGEVSPAFYGRTDQESYFVSARALLNVIASQTGPGIGRGGTMHVSPVKNSAHRTLIVPFQFNEEQAYIAEFGDGYVRIYRNRGRQYEDALTITGITQANPAVVTVNHRLTKGKTIRISGVAGMTQLNGNFYLVDHALGTGKNITDVDRSSPVKMTLDGGHGFVGGEDVFVESVGGMTQINDRTFRLDPVTSTELAITAISQANPAVVTVSGNHGLTDGETVLIENVVGMTQLNNRRFVISPKYSATATITDITEANPAVVTTSTNHGWSHGDRVRIQSVSGMTQVNDRDFTIARVVASGKTISGMLSGTNGVVRLLVESHGYSTGDFIYVSAIGYATQLLGKQFVATNAGTDYVELQGTHINSVSKGPNFFGLYSESGTLQKVDKTKFSLVGENATGHTAYSSGGTAKKILLDQFELDGENSSTHGAYVEDGTASVVNVNEFYLRGENGLTHTAWTSGGTVKAVGTTSLKLQTLAGANVNSTGYGAYSGPGGTIEAVHEIASPYAYDDLFDADGLPLLQWAQSADFLFLAHPNYHPRQLTRAGHADFSLTEFINEEGPFGDENLGDTTIYVTAEAGTGVGATVTLTANVPLWQEGHIGAMWEVRLKDGATAGIWTTGVAFTLGQEILSGNLFYRCTDAGTSGTEAPTHDIGEAFDGADTSANCKWLYIHNGRGIVIITGFTSPTQVTATVISELPAGTVGIENATGRWKEGAWSGVQGYPRAVGIHEGRIVWAGTDQEPLALDFSNAESLFYFNPIELDGTVTRGSAFRRYLDGDNPIRWVKSTEKGLIVGTLAGEWVVGTEGVTQGFGPDTAVARQFSANGAAAIQPVRNGDSILYPQRARKRMRDITFSIDQQKLVTSDRNLRADHIAQEGIIAIAYAEEPHRITWCLLQDGKLAGLTYNREPGAQVSAWHRHTIGGSFGDGDAVVESIAVIAGPDETTDDVWLAVKRTIDGNTYRSIEYMTRPLDYGEDIEDGVYMDAAYSYTGTAAVNVTGLDHLEGCEVVVLAGGIFYEREVDGGTLDEDLPDAVTPIHVGLFSMRVIEPVYIESGPNDRVNTKSKQKRVNAVQLEVVETGPGIYVGTEEGSMDRVEMDEFYTGDVPRRVSGFVEESINDSYDKRKGVRVEQREPYPLMIPSITARFEVSNE